MTAADEKPHLSKLEQQAIRNRYKHEAALAVRAARGQKSPARPVAERKKVVHTKTGLDWLRDKQRLDARQFRAGRTYGTLYRAAILPDGARLRSCLDDTPRGSGPGAGLPTRLVATEWLAESRLRLDAVRAAMGRHPGLIQACDLICGQGLTPRDISPIQREAEQIETGLRIALDLAYGWFTTAGWPE